MAKKSRAKLGELTVGVNVVVLGLVFILFATFLCFAFGVGCHAAKRRQAHDVQLAEIAVSSNEKLLARCRQDNAALQSNVLASAQAIRELMQRKEDLFRMISIDRERAASSRGLLRACRDALAEGRRILSGAASQKPTLYIQWLQARRRNLGVEHEKLTEDSLGADQHRRQDDIRALQRAITEEMRAQTDAARRVATNGDVCTNSTVRYSVVFDIGSTGNRVHVYKYAIRGTGDTAAVTRDVLSESDLVEELFELNHVALSKLANPVLEAPGVLSDLFLKAEAYVPAELQVCTPIEFKATAGLRMLGAEAAAKILAGIREHYRHEVFWLRGEAPVRILDGREEGPLAWLAVNFLLGAFNTSTAVAVSTVAIIDIGGGSTQIVFEPGEEMFNTVHPDFRYLASFANRHVRAYQHSYEGYGLHAATRELLVNIQGKREEKPGGGAIRATMTASTRAPEKAGGSCSLSPLSAGNMATDEDNVDGVTNLLPPPPRDEEAVVAFPCFAVGYEDSLGVKNTKYGASGKPVTLPNLQGCASLFRDRLLKRVGMSCKATHCGIAGVPQPPLARFTGDIYAFSFLFDLLRLANSSLLPTGAVVSDEKFEVKLADIANVAEGHCAALSLTRITERTAKGDLSSLKPEYECMYYSYVYALLRYGYEVPEDRVLHVAKKIGGYETAWSLGASLLSFTQIVSPRSGHGAQ
ncbi:uncharacterized protein JKF63_07951 [Porcisia hertigi]|uniref:Nucleoside phosphatase n=1 Tax=Porcisia hertigi TaxID=2761500 RepID=A0A836H7S6_9TRYP|nr:hypothetical protein JKF63_07951 [Porcisia hertigi]